MAHTFATLYPHVIFSIQDQHHRRVTFQEEFIAFLKRHGMAYDEHFIWE